MHFEHSEFVVDLAPAWRNVPGSDSEQFQFQADSLASTITISVMQARVPRPQLQQVAEKFLELRLEGEAEVDKRRVVTLGDRWVTPQSDGEVVDIAYAGYDNVGRIFRFMGFVTTQKVISFYCETISTDNERAIQIFDEAFRGFQFYVP
jgi:hypothetical protein